jgi:hypothetical protein
MDEFFRTRMGHRFFEATMPRIADELARLNRNIEALVDELRRHREGDAGGDAAPARPGAPKTT